MKFLSKRLPLFVAAFLLPLSAHAHLIGDHSSPATHTSVGLEHIFLAGLVTAIAYGIYKKLS